MDDARRQQLQKILDIAKDFRRYCKNNLKILNKQGKLVPFELNQEQEMIVKAVLTCIEEERPIRFIILKDRQIGVSTVIESLIYWWTATHKNIQSKIVAHDTTTSLKLYNMFKRYYDNSNPLFKPVTKYNTRNDLTFDNDEGTGLKSQIDTSSAENTSSGRGDTIHWLHGCLHENSLVVLADGSSKRIADIEIGDRVFTSSGAVASVSSKSMGGGEKRYELKTWMTNEPIIASADHKIMTDIGYKKLSELTNDDWIAKPRYRFEEKYNWTFTIPKIERPQGGGKQTEIERTFALDEDFGYLVGYYLAEGHISKNLQRVTFTFEKDETFVKRFENLFVNVPRYIQEGNRGRAQFGDTFMAKALYELCGRVTNKHVPLFGNEWFFRGIYRGYMDGDGSKTDVQRERAPSIHEKIARNINRIGNILGMHGSLHYAERERYGIPCKPIWINSFCHGNDKPHIRKYKFIDGQCFVKVKLVSEYEIAKTYDLEIAHPDHNFETPSGVVSNSEVAVWRNGEELVSGLMQAVPMLADTAIFLESTANGVGDFFHRTWQAAKRGESAFTPLFFPWSMHQKYRLPVSDTFQPSKEEAELKKLHGLDDEQLMWRREKQKEFVSNPPKFFQEYPLTDAEAFLSSGSPRFDISKLIAMEEACRAPKELELYEFSDIEGQKITAKPLTNSPLKVWEEPKEKHDYVIGADVAEGIGGDYSVATIVDKDNQRTVARWRGDIQPADFGEVLEQLGRWYNRALIGVEINNHGLTTVQRLVDIGYDRLYRKESGIDERYQEYTSKLGWRTDVRSKPLMIDGLAEAIAKGQMEDYDRVFINECMTYVTDERGKTNAQEGCHDDTVLATAIAYQLFEWTDVVKQKLLVQSRYPANYMAKRKANKELVKKRKVLQYR